ncbi:DNA double-strand break repair nuclease NurA [Methanooceanicella nereidis]|nr:DNA double-strand break repair nuclease NurA [Methanocella sp. CWC-04]
MLDNIDRSANDRLPRYSGCRVYEEGPFVRKSENRFQNRKQATDWALSILKGKAVAAVDGSQIFPSREISISIGLAQACMVVNRHKDGGAYDLSSIMSIVVPGDFEKLGSNFSYSQAPVSLKRFELECERIAEFMTSEPGSLIFLDGSIVLSFINQVDERLRERYISAMVKVLDTSEKTRTPVAAFTDLSLNRDIVTFMQKYFRLQYNPYLKDVHLIKRVLEWGDRTRVFLSDRDDRSGKDNLSVLDRYGEYRNSVAFFYLQTSGELPSKVEIPEWCCREGLTDSIADIVRAESIIRPGYPDIIHRAHEFAKISQSENELFNGMLESFAAQNDIRLYRSAKEFNKQLGMKR